MKYRYSCLLILLLLSGLFIFRPSYGKNDPLANIENLLKSRPDSAYLVLKELLAGSVEDRNELMQAICHQKIGQVFYFNSNYSQAVDHLLKADKLFRAQKKTDWLSRNLNLLGEVYYYNRQPDLASLQFEEALAINSMTDNKSGLALTYGNIGHLYEKKWKYDSARYYQYLAISLYRNANDSHGIAKIYENLGSIFEDNNSFDSASQYFTRALELNDKLGDEVAMIEILNNLGDINRKTGKIAIGFEFTRKALNLASKTGSSYQMASAYRDIGKSFELLKQFDSAYYYNELSRQLIQHIYSSSNNQQIALIETIYEVEKKNSQIAQLAADKKLNTIVTVSVILLVVLLLILGVVIFSRQNLKIRTAREINEQNRQIYEKDRELTQAELRNKQLEEEKLRNSLEVRSKELSAHTLHIIQKNQLLEELRVSLNDMLADDKRDQKKQLKKLAQKININFSQDLYWDEFRSIFDQVHQTFFINLKNYADSFTPGELKLVALIRMNLSSTDIATLLGISLDSLRVSRYRLRKKLGLSEGESLSGFLQRL